MNRIELVRDLDILRTLGLEYAKAHESKNTELAEELEPKLKAVCRSFEEKYPELANCIMNLIEGNLKKEWN